MSSGDIFIGSTYKVESLRSLNDRLNAEVMEQINSTQELVLLNNFAHENNEYILRKSLQERMSDIESWRWVLIDLTRRLEEAVGALKHEHNALRVVVERIQNEIDEHSLEATQPGALSPLSDSVEDSINQELHFLSDQKAKFERMIPDLDKQIEMLIKTNKKIENDILRKQRALSIDESCLNVNPNSSVIESGKKKKKRVSPLIRWEKRCETLKRAGLRALSNAIIVRQQARGARVHLSIAAQAYSARVDSALRRRLHVNKIKLQDLNWQREEAIQDYKALEEELTTTEQSILEILDQERTVQARLADRVLRPIGEHTKDNVDKKLKEELGRLRNFSKHLRKNHERITILQNSLTDSISRVNCCADDIVQVVRLDEERIRSRLGEEPDSAITPVTQDYLSNQTMSTNFKVHDIPLACIKEEDEDSYPFED